MSSSCAGCVSVEVKVLDFAGAVVATIAGFLANGGHLSLENALELGPGEKAFVHPDRGHKLEVRSIAPSKGKGKKADMRFRYEVQLVPA